VTPPRPSANTEPRWRCSSRSATAVRVTDPAALLADALIDQVFREARRAEGQLAAIEAA